MKMLAHEWLAETMGENFNLYVLGGVVLILATGAIASMLISGVERGQRGHKSVRM